MIRGFRDRDLRGFFEHDIRFRRMPAETAGRLFRKLQIIDAAVSEADLRVPPGNRFEHLKGSLDGWCSIRVNRRWRLVFRWDGGSGGAHDVYLDDHSYD